MKKQILTLFALAGSVMAFAQLPVSTTPENKNVVLEEFTGIHCVYCPDGHKRANLLKASAPDDVFLINIHTGGYAVPNAGEPDFRTAFGTSLGNQSGLTGYPAGTVNRHVFSSLAMASGATAMSRANWNTAASQILSQPSYVNVAVQASVDVQTRIMTVNVEVYFTSNAGKNVNLNVALTQDNVEGPQTGGSNFYPEMILPNGNYNHNHMLRHLITGQWGEVITTTTAGTLVQKQYTYTLPTTINSVPLTLGDLEVIAFIVEGQQELISGNDGPITYTNFAAPLNAKANSVVTDSKICGDSLFAKMQILNNGMDTITSMVIEYSVNGGTPQLYNWNGALTTFQSEDINLPGYLFAPLASNTVQAKIVSVNGVQDGDTTDNISTATGIGLADVGQGMSYQLTVVQDRYGSEITWDFVDENGTSVASGGPYSDLSANGTLPHTHYVTLPAYGCYKLQMHDSYGDGFNVTPNGYGVGSYTLKDASLTTVITSNAQFAYEEENPFQAAMPTGLSKTELSDNIILAPNPTNDVAQLRIDLSENTTVSVDLYNTLGSKILSLGNQSLSAGIHSLEIDTKNIENGVYFVNIKANDQVVTKRLSVIK